MTITIVCDKHRRPYRVARYGRATAEGRDQVPLTGLTAEPGEWCEVAPPPTARDRREATEQVRNSWHYAQQPGRRAVERVPVESPLESPRWDAVADKLNPFFRALAQPYRTTVDNRCPRCGQNVQLRAEKLVPLLDALEAQGWDKAVPLDLLRKMAQRADASNME